MALRFLAFLALCVLSSDGVDAKPPFSFSFERFDKKPSFSSEIELYGNAELSNSSAVRLSSKGRMMYKKPIRFFGTDPGFSTYFAFSISEFCGKTLAFLLVPNNVSLTSRISPSFLAVKFVADRKGGHVEIDIGNEVSVISSNFSTVGLIFNSGQKFHCWIDYDGVSRILEVRISKSRGLRTSSSLVSLPIDFSNALWRWPMYIGISSYSGSSTQISSVYSWSFVVKHGARYLVHSEPLDPQSSPVRSHQEPPVHVRGSSHWRILMALLFGAACGSSVAFIVFFLRSKRHPVAPVEYPVLTVEKIVVDARKVVDNSA